MSDDNAPQLASTERLVAYLDGEMPESATRDLEQSLNHDSAMRTELEKLNRAWELLDLLPRPHVSGEFTSRTVTAIQAVVPAAAETVAPKRQVNRAVVFAAGLMLIAGIGFEIGRYTARPAPDPLLDDLPVVENLDLLLEVGDVQFLRELQNQGGPDGRPMPER